MKDIPVKRGRRLIASLVSQGEHAQQDFKYAISDARKIARSISAFANAGGGRLLIGVKDNGAIAGVRNEEDVYMVELAAHRYCDPGQEVEFQAYSIDTGVVVIMASIAAAPRRPVSVIEADGCRRAYYRVADENIVAHPLMVAAWCTESPVTFSLDHEASRLLDTLDAAGDQGLSVTDIALALGISRRRAERLITNLAATDIITFVYRAPEFRITRQLS